jgi:predicted  nucleic acid-binding Zn-ribbon protein
MPPLSIDVRDAITIITGILTIAGVVSAMRSGISKLSDGQDVLKAGQVEGNRKIDALHKRLDHYGDEITRLDKSHVRLDERIKALKESQSFRLRARLAAAEAEEAGEPPMFIEEDDQ